MLRYYVLLILSAALVFAMAACAVAACENPNRTAAIYAEDGALFLELTLSDDEKEGSAALLVTLTVPGGTTFTLLPPSPDLTLTVGEPSPVKEVETLTVQEILTQEEGEGSDKTAPAVVRVTLLIDGPLADFLPAQGSDALPLLCVGGAAPPVEPFSTGKTADTGETITVDVTTGVTTGVTTDASTDASTSVPSVTAIITEASLWVKLSGHNTAPVRCPLAICRPTEEFATTSPGDETTPPQAPPSTDETGEESLPGKENFFETRENDPASEETAKEHDSTGEAPVFVAATTETRGDAGFAVTLFFAAPAPMTPVVCLPAPLPSEQARPTPRPLTLQVVRRDDPPIIGPPNPAPTMHIYAATYAGLSAGRTYRFLMYMPAGVVEIRVRDGVVLG